MVYYVQLFLDHGDSHNEDMCGRCAMGPLSVLYILFFWRWITVMGIHKYRANLKL